MSEGVAALVATAARADPKKIAEISFFLLSAKKHPDIFCLENGKALIHL
jgi:hypothetical protein